MGGAIDSVSRITEGIKNTATLWDEDKKQRARLPRFIGPDKAIHSFDEEKARGQERLRSLDDERFARDWFHSQYLLREGHLIVTNRNLIYLDRSDNVQWRSCAWHSRFAVDLCVHFGVPQDE